MWVRVFDDTERSLEGGGRGFEIRPKGRDLHVLRLWGPMPRRWAEGVCSGLARARMTIESGVAIREGPELWSASFHISSGKAIRDPLSLDLLSLALHPPTPADWIPLRIEGFTLADDPERAALRVDLFGPDQHGFLGGLLQRLGFLGLVPVEMVIETGSEGLYDVLHLQTTEGTSPSGVHRRAVAKLLEGCVLAPRQG
ncbi:MAG: hypothetical protein JRH01_07520 [Deltaproteobacteria bacterium]|nr:hypothetical protein [Deltaproteobacteria bacterium]MBW2393766.1 hypothetical protein [Deltaproteobacteria bacterium]